jgi:LemA protein
MSSLSLVVLLVLALVLFAAIAWGIGLYNSLIQVKHGVDQAWANIDVLLKQRADELGKLLDVVKVYMGHERDTLERLTRLRSEVARGGEDAARMTAERALGQETARLLVTAEAYPELRSSENFRELQQRISALEEQIAHRREYFNAAVNINNVRLEQVPDSLLAGMAGLHRRELLQVAEEDKRNVDVLARLRA